MRFDEEARSRGSDEVIPFSTAMPTSTPPMLPPGRRWRAHPTATAFLRMARRPWLLSVVAVGLLLIDLLACVVPLYLQLISTTQLQTAIRQAPAPTRNLLITAHSDATNMAIHQWAATQVEAEAQQQLASFSQTAPLRYLQSDLLALVQAGSYRYSTIAPQLAQVESFDFAMIRPHMRLLQGSLPQTAPAGQPTQVLITQEMADAFDLQIGQQVVIAKSTRAATQDQQVPVSVLITGIWTPLSGTDPFWNGLRFQSMFTPLQVYPPPIWPLLTTDAGLYATLDTLPHVGVTQNWVYYVDPTRVTATTSAVIPGQLTTLRVRLATTFNERSSEVQENVRGNLDQLLQGTQRQLHFLSLPLYLIASQIVALAVLFVAAMARLLITAQEQEIVTLKSRGASSPQLLGVFTTQSVPPGLLATIAGPLLALGVALLLVRWFLPGNAADLSSLLGTTSGASLTKLTGLSRLPQSLAQLLPIMLPAVAGSVLGIGMVIASGFSVARLDVLAFRRELARPTGVPFWQRYYLDLGLVVICALGYLELSQFGTTQTRLALNAQSNSLLLLAAPAPLLLAGGLLLVRLLPLVARGAVRLTQRGRGIAMMLAMAQVARTPARYTQMILLLALAVGLGLFALTFDASLARNVQDRTAYATGADLRLQTRLTIGAQDVGTYAARLQGLSGVEAVTGVYRGTGSVLVGQNQQTTDMLGVDPSTFARVAEATSWRSDYAAESLPGLMAQLQAHQNDQGGAAAGSQAHPLWVLVSTTLAQRLHVQVGDRIQVTVTDVTYAPTSAVVGAIVADFPTLYPDNAPGGFIVCNVQDLTAIVNANAQLGIVVGANEFWLRTAGPLTQDRALVQTLYAQSDHLAITTVQSSRAALAQAETNPANGGMRGLLLLGAVAAALLAVLGSLVQAVFAARQRMRQFAVLRTLGMGARQLVATLLGEQLVVYLFGLVAGTLLGLLLLTATVPYLQFSDTLIDPTTVGVPGYLLRINWTTTGLFYGALLLAFLLALGLTARFAATLGLSRTLRIGED